jgi:hypothetical protein
MKYYYDFIFGFNVQTYYIFNIKFLKGGYVEREPLEIYRIQGWKGV